jgi:hypothetical protein
VWSASPPGCARAPLSRRWRSDCARPASASRRGATSTRALAATSKRVSRAVRL